MTRVTEMRMMMKEVDLSRCWGKACLLVCFMEEYSMTWRWVCDDFPWARLYFGMGTFKCSTIYGEDFGAPIIPYAVL